MPTRTFHPDELAFLNAIHADPRDDTPRLVYADWLDEHGDSAQAEFIRLQCDTARRVGDWSACNYTQREKQLVKKHGSRWRGKRFRHGGYLPGGVRFTRFHRGLPDVAFSTSNDDVFLQQELNAAAVAIGEVPHWQLQVVLTVYTSGEDVSSVLKHPIYLRAQRIHVRSHQVTATINGQPHVEESPVPDGAIDALVRAFKNRKMLYISFGQISAASKSLIKAELSPHVPTLMPAFV